MRHRKLRSIAVALVITGLMVTGVQLAYGANSQVGDTAVSKPMKPQKSGKAKKPAIAVKAVPSTSLIDSLGPSDGIFTCEWIAEHPTEASAFDVSCSEDMVNPGADLVQAERWRSEIAAELRERVRVLSDGCGNVPSSGTISPGVYAASSFQYTTHWAWSNGIGQNFYWYVKKTDDSIQTSGVSYGGSGGTPALPPNVYRWQVYNAGSNPASWFICWNDD